MDPQDHRIAQRPHAGAEPASRPAAHLGTVVLREAYLADESPIAAIEEACFPDPRERFDAGKIRYLLRSNRVSVKIAQAGDTLLGWVAGFASVHRPQPWGRIYAVAVHPDARGMKLGTLLTQNMVHELQRQGARRVFLEVKADNTSALRLYHKLGFISCRKLADYYGPGLDAQRMEFVCPHPLGCAQ